MTSTSPFRRNRCTASAAAGADEKEALGTSPVASTRSDTSHVATSSAMPTSRLVPIHTRTIAPPSRFQRANDLRTSLSPASSASRSPSMGWAVSCTVHASARTTRASTSRRHIRRGRTCVRADMGRTHVFERRSRIDAPAEAAFAWHLRAGAFERLLPPGDGTRVLQRSGRIEDDSMRVELSVPVLGPVRQRWMIRHEGFEPGRRFTDVLERGPFRSWRHEHLVEPIDAQSCELVDHVEFELPAGRAGATFGLPVVRRKLGPMFEHRHAITVGDLAAHQESGLAPLRIQVEGTARDEHQLQLVAFLSTGGHDVAAAVALAGAAIARRHQDPDASVLVGSGENSGARRG